MTNSAKVVWSLWILLVLLAFSALEISGYFGAPWSTLTEFIRTQETHAQIIKWVLLIGLAILMVHLTGDWP